MSMRSTCLLMLREGVHKQKYELCGVALLLQKSKMQIV